MTVSELIKILSQYNENTIVVTHGICGNYTNDVNVVEKDNKVIIYGF